MKGIQDESESSLTKCACAGSHEAFREIVRRHRNLVYGLIARQVGDLSLAEDLAQEVFVKAYRALPSFRGEATLKTWLTRIALNHTRSYFVSRKKRERSLTDSFDAESHDQHGKIPHDPVEQQHMRNSLRLCFSKLKGNSQIVITLCGFQQESYESAAKILQTPVGTIRSRLHHARMELRECLKKSGVEVES